MPRKGTIDTIFSLIQIMEKYEVAGKQLLIVFVDLKTVFDQVPRKIIWWALSYFLILFYLYIYPPDSQESNKSANM